MNRAEKLKIYAAARAKSANIAEELKEVDREILALEDSLPELSDEDNDRLERLEEEWTRINNELQESYKAAEKLHNELVD